MTTDLTTENRHTDVADTAQIADDGDAPRDASAVKDGRQLRRLRNIEAVRAAILALHEERAPIDLETVAARAGVTVRSIYRYHADLDAAVAEALQHRVDHIYGVWGAQVLPSPLEPLGVRIDQMLDHRLQLERLGRPLRNLVQMQNPDGDFDRQVIEVFEPELSAIGGESRATITASVCYMLRPRGLRAMIEFPQYGLADPRAMVSATIMRLLAPGAG